MQKVLNDGINANRKRYSDLVSTGIKYYNERNYGLAEKHFSKATELDEKNPKGYYYYALSVGHSDYAFYALLYSLKYATETPNEQREKIKRQIKRVLQKVGIVEQDIVHKISEYVSKNDIDTFPSPLKDDHTKMYKYSKEYVATIVALSRSPASSDPSKITSHIPESEASKQQKSNVILESVWHDASQVIGGHRESGDGD